MLSLQRRRKRGASDDISDRPTAKPRTETIVIKDEEDDSEHLPNQMQDLLRVSSSTVVGEDGIENPDPEVEGKLQEALDNLIHKKRNIFITGPAGSGKSYMTKGLIAHLEALGHRCYLIAYTGSAAMNVGGHTCHSFFGLTPNITRRGIMEVIKASKRPKTQDRLQKTKFLFIDEISMVSKEFFEQMSRMAQEVRNDTRRAFGGITMILLGDFGQLPPVKPQETCIECGESRAPRGDLMECPTHGAVHDSSKWAFASEHWRRLKLKNIILTKILRQPDETYSQIVWDLWLGNTLNAAQIELITRDRPVIEPTLRLFMTRKAVSAYNKKEWDKLTTPRVRYLCYDKFVMNDAHRNRRWLQRMAELTEPHHTLASLREHRYPEDLLLREGMPVILLHNLSVRRGLVNGSHGTIIGFETYSPTQIRASGGDLDAMGFSWGDEDGLVMEDYIPSLGGSYADWAHRAVRAFWERNSADTVPIVKFSNGIVATVAPECCIEEVVFDAKISLKMRAQVPLMAGWAATVHRAQGMSLDRVVVDYAHAFENAQYYVGMSRSRTIEGLRVRNLDRRDLLGHPPEVLAFMREILPDHIKSQMRG